MFSERLKILRENANLLQKELASILNVTSQTISGWEINRTTPDYDTLVKIANYFNVSVDYLLGNETKANSYENQLKEQEILKKALQKSGFMKNDEDLSDEELDKLMKFVNANKEFLKDNK